MIERSMECDIRKQNAISTKYLIISSGFAIVYVLKEVGLEHIPAIK